MRDRENLLKALARLADEDPTFLWREDESTGQLVISGMGELHLEIMLDRMLREHKIALRTGRPVVLKQETLAEPATGSGSFTAGTEDGAIEVHAEVALKPAERGSGCAVVLAAGLPIKEAERPVLTQTILDTLQSGPINGEPIVDVAVELRELRAEGTLEVAGARAIAVANALREALKSAKTQTLEPLMRVDIAVPPENVGEVIGGIQARKGQVDEIEEGTARSSVRATVPLAAMFGYATELRNASQGRGTFVMHFLRYDVAPAG